MLKRRVLAGADFSGDNSLAKSKCSFAPKEGGMGYGLKRQDRRSSFDSIRGVDA